jgi:hypothetical protein
MFWESTPSETFVTEKSFALITTPCKLWVLCRLSYLKRGPTGQKVLRSTAQPSAYAPLLPVGKVTCTFPTAQLFSKFAHYISVSHFYVQKVVTLKVISVDHTVLNRHALLLRAGEEPLTDQDRMFLGQHGIKNSVLAGIVYPSFLLNKTH